MGSPDPHFEELLRYLKEARGFDFTGYKRSSLMRRINRRMAQLKIPEYPVYQDFLQVHPDEFTALFNTVLINVTSFFRDPEAWRHLRTAVLEPMIAAKPPGAPIRVWCAGCASGEEAYTLAMVLGETLGPAAMRERVKIYATDVDDEQLAEARQATYGPESMEAVPGELVPRYFEPAGMRQRFRPDLRRTVIFGRNDLVQDAPISRIDLLTCRNTLMYLTAETQARIISRFHFALHDGGALFLGRAETLLNHGAMFQPMDARHRVFQKVPRHNVPHPAPFHEPAVAPGRDPAGVELVRRTALLAGPVAEIVLTADGTVAMTNRMADELLGLGARDVGRSFQDLDVSYRPVELRPHIDKALAQRRTVLVKDILQRVPGRSGPVDLEVQVIPLLDGWDPIGVTLAFHDVTTARGLRADLENANRDRETAYEELQSTNEELETANEELQSTVEELEATNEELQTVIERLRVSSAELDDANGFFDAILSHLRAAIVVIGPALDIRVWNTQAAELWGLRADEATGRHLLDLGIGLPVGRLRPLIRQAVAGQDPEGGEIELEAVNRRGRTIMVRVVCFPMLRDGAVTGVILTMETARA